VTTVVDALYRRHPELAQRFGEAGVRACRQDIHYHLDYLDGAMASGETTLFTNYALWLKAVLESRGVPSAHLAESLELLDRFFAEHLPAAEAAALHGLLAAGRDALGRTGLPTTCIPARVAALTQAMPYREAALSGNHSLAESLMNQAMQAGHSLSEASVRLIQPAMYEVGRLWQENRISVAKEHLATAISQNVLARAYLQATFAPPIGRSALFAAVAGNHHGLGLRMLSDAFETTGWSSLYLGTDVPAGDLIREIDAAAPDLVCLSLSLPVHLAETRDTVARLRSELGSRCPTIWVGGQATLATDRVWRSLGADGWAADALHAIEQWQP
jgi:methanogenic corrinoid protein MtbC1